MVKNKMIIITPETIINKGANKLNAKSVFLAGTIDNGDSFNWQQEVIDKLAKYDMSIEIYNPRRDNWDPNATSKDVEKQIKWEQDHLDKADLITMVILDNSKSPISLLEIGLYAQSNKLIIFCNESYYRYDNVKMTALKYNIPLINSIDTDIIANKIIANL